jgi:hypothetical protein
VEISMAEDLNTPTRPEMFRRFFAKRAALALPIIAAGGIDLAQASTHHPDAALLETCAQIDALTEEKSAFYRRNDEAFERYRLVEPPRPEPLRFREEDAALGLPRSREWNGDKQDFDGPSDWFLHPEVAAISRWIEDGTISIRAHSRGQEIVAAHDAWVDHCEEVAASVGADFYDGIAEDLHNRLNPLYAEVIATPTHTVEGFRAKGRMSRGATIPKMPNDGRAAYSVPCWRSSPAATHRLSLRKFAHPRGRRATAGLLYLAGLLVPGLLAAEWGRDGGLSRERIGDKLIAAPPFDLGEPSLEMGIVYLTKHDGWHILGSRGVSP